MSASPGHAPGPGPVLLAPLTGLPEIIVGADLAGLLLTALEPLGGLQHGDVLAVSSKVVSKARGLRVPLPEGADEATARAAREAVVAGQTVRVVAERSTVTGTTRVVEAVAGPVMAAAGVDASNTGPDGGILLLPADPDAEAHALHTALLERRPGVRCGVLLTDTAGRAWRAGQTDFALGAHGIAVLDDLRGGTDADGRPLAVTARAVADELAAAADLVKGKDGGVAAALLRGLPQAVVPTGPDAGTSPEGLPGARSLVRTGPGDWFATGHREAVRAALGAPPGSPAARDVGLPSTTLEPEADRAARAVRLALLDHPGVEVATDPDGGYVVTSPDPVAAGRVAARLEVALRGEDLDPAAGEVRVRTGAG